MFVSAAVLVVVAVSSVACDDENNKEINVSTQLGNADGSKILTLHASQNPGLRPQDPVSKSFGAGLQLTSDNGVVGSVGATHSMGPAKSNTQVDLGASVPLLKSDNGVLAANGHASRMLESPQKSAGGGLQYQNTKGVSAGLDATHHFGLGNSYSANVGINKQVGAGTLSVGSSASQNTWSSQKSVGGKIQYNQRNGVSGSLEATHHFGLGNSYGANVGINKQIGPGTLSVGAGASQNTWSPGMDKKIFTSYGLRF